MSRRTHILNPSSPCFWWCPSRPYLNIASAMAQIKAWKLERLGLQFHSGPPRLKFSPCSRCGNVATDKRPPERQTGRSVQLQDASAGGPEEGCSALHSAERCRAVQRKTGYRCSRLRAICQGGLRKKNVNACSHTEKSARSLGNVQGFPEQLWSPGRPLGQSANVRGASMPRFSVRFESHFTSVMQATLAWEQ